MRKGLRDASQEIARLGGSEIAVEQRSVHTRISFTVDGQRASIDMHKGSIRAEPVRTIRGRFNRIRRALKQGE